MIEEEVEKLLSESPKNLSALQMLAQAYVHQQKYDAAEEIVEQMIVIDPDQERPIKPLLDAMAYMKANPGYDKKLDHFTGYFRSEHSEMLDRFQVSNRGIYARTVGTPGWYLFPSGDNHLIRGGLEESRLIEYLQNDTGEVYALIEKQGNKIRDIWTSYYWKQNSLIWQAEELLRARDYERAATAYDKLLAAHSEHYYLYDAQAHLAYMASKTEVEIQELYQRYVGDYEGIRIRIENGELLYKRPGLPRRVLRPIADTEFMTLSRYVNRYAFDVAQGKVKGIYYYEYDNEAREWRRDEELYFARTELAD